LLALFRPEAGAVVRDDHLETLPPLDLCRRAAEGDPSRPTCYAQGIIQQVTEDMPEVEGAHFAPQVGDLDLLPQLGIPVRPRGAELCPGLPPDLGQVAALQLQPDGGGIFADTIEEAVKVVLGPLDALDQLQGLRLIVEAEAQDRQARLAALEGVAALVSQAGN